jgi:hypothetical protein
MASLGLIMVPRGGHLSIITGYTGVKAVLRISAKFGIVKISVARHKQQPTKRKMAGSD